MAEAAHRMSPPVRDADALYRAGIAARDAGQLGEAERSLREALRGDPEDARAANALGTVLLAQGRLDRAEAVLRAALRRHPAAGVLHHNLGLVLRQRRDFAAAAAALRQATLLQPDLVEAHDSLGNTLRDLGQTAEAERSFLAALRLAPTRPHTHYNLSMLHLSQGRYVEGWPRWEARIPVLGIREFPQPRWQGEPLDGRTLLIHAEQGFGDTLQFCRFVPRVAAMGRVLFLVPRALARLVAPLGANVVAHDEALPAFDLHIPLMSLPGALSVTLADLPGGIPYLTGDPAPWAARLAAHPRPRVGLAWAGNPAFPSFAAKSVPPGKLEKLLRAPGVCFVSLQKDAVGGTMRPPRGSTWLDWTGELGDFADTAGLVSALDLVISIDTAVAHLAGALGRPVWLLDRADTCWRWLRDREDSPWYPGLRIFRQTQPGDWDGVLQRVGQALAIWSAERAAGSRG